MNRSAETQKLLRCTAFEEFMLDQDGPDHPCVICLRLELQGDLDSLRLKQALSAVVQRHPLLRARLEVHWGKLWWRIQSDIAVDLQIHSAPVPQWPPARYFDLTRAGGWQADLYSLGSTSSCVLFLQVHHALADGLGCLQVAEDLLREYDNPGSLTERTFELGLAQRNRFGLNILKVLQLLPKQCVGLAGVRQFLTRQPSPMICSARSQPASTLITALKLKLTKEHTQSLKQVAKSRQATLNDYLACLVFEACDELRRDATSYDPAAWLRMMVPMSLRNGQSQQLSACNVVTCVFLDRTGRQISSQRELLPSIHDEMELIKRNRLGLIFIFSLWVRKVCRLRGAAIALAGCAASSMPNLDRVLQHGAHL